jgi:hypothetical protein
MWYDRFLSKRLAMAITGIVTAVQAGGEPAQVAMNVTVIVIAYIAAESARPSGGDDGNE